MKNKDDADNQIFSKALIFDEATHFITDPRFDTPVQKVFRRAANYMTQSRRAAEYAKIDYASLELKVMAEADRIIFANLRRQQRFRSGVELSETELQQFRHFGVLVKDRDDWPQKLTCQICGFKTTTSDSGSAHFQAKHIPITNRA